MRSQRLVGLIVVIVVVAATAAYLLLTSGNLDPSAPRGDLVRARVAHGVAGFLGDPEVARLLLRRYDLRVEEEAAGSLGVVRGDVAGLDFLWPATETAGEAYRLAGGAGEVRASGLGSPLVVYAWRPAAEALERQGLVRAGEDGVYTLDLGGLLALMEEEPAWADLGATDLPGRVAVHAADPSRADGGAQFAGLLALTAQAGAVRDTDLGALLPGLGAYYGRLGYLPATDEGLFGQFLAQGAGSYALVAGEERLLLGYVARRPEALEGVAEGVRVLYPRPTAWSAYPLIARSDAGERLAEALGDPEIQALAWQGHGLRAGAVDPSVLPVAGIPAAVEEVVALPGVSVLDRLTQAIAP